MSNTERANNVVKAGWTSTFMRRKRVVIPDGREEIIALDVVHEALKPLSSDAQNRVIEHVVKLLNERARAINSYEFEE